MTQLVTRWLRDSLGPRTLALYKFIVRPVPAGKGIRTTINFRGASAPTLSGPDSGRFARDKPLNSPTRKNQLQFTANPRSCKRSIRYKLLARERKGFRRAIDRKPPPCLSARALFANLLNRRVDLELQLGLNLVIRKNGRVCAFACSWLIRINTWGRFLVIFRFNNNLIILLLKYVLQSL